MKKTVLLQELKSRKHMLGAMAILELLRGLLSFGAAYALAALLDSLFQGAFTWEKAVPWLGVLFFAVCCRSLLHYPCSILPARLALNVQEALRQRLHDTLLQIPPLTANRLAGGHLAGLCTDVVEGTAGFYTVCLPIVLQLAVLMPFYLCIALWLDQATALLFFLTLPIAPFLLYLIGNLTRKRSRQQWQKLLLLDRRLQELLRGIPMLKLFNRSKEQEAIVRQDSLAFSQATMQVLQTAFISAFALELITTLSIALIAVSCGLRLLYGEISFFTAFLILLLAPEFYQPLRQSGTAFHAAMEAFTAAEKITEFLAGEKHFSPYAQAPANSAAPIGFTAAVSPVSADTPDNHNISGNSVTAVLPAASTATVTSAICSSVPPSVTFSHVSCAYPGSNAMVISDLSFAAPAGKITALTGTSGSGKSTVFLLLTGTLQPTSGSISFRPSTSCTHVPQNIHIFSASLRDNLLLGRKAISDKQLTEALKKSALHHWFMALPHGLDTQLGDGSALALSAGECRRLGLARALLQPAPVLLLDEITAGLDNATEKTVLQTILALSGRHTILLATHRPAAIAIAHHVINLDE